MGQRNTKQDADITEDFGFLLSISTKKEQRRRKKGKFEGCKKIFNFFYQTSKHRQKVFEEKNVKKRKRTRILHEKPKYSGGHHPWPFFQRSTENKSKRNRKDQENKKKRRKKKRFQETDSAAPNFISGNEKAMRRSRKCIADKPRTKLAPFLETP